MTTPRSLHTVKKDELLTLLADDRRRTILTSLRDLPRDAISVDQLVDEIDEDDHVGDDVTEISLVHSALPKLAAAGVVDFDKQSMTVLYQADPRVERLLNVIVGL